MLSKIQGQDHYHIFSKNPNKLFEVDDDNPLYSNNLSMPTKNIRKVDQKYEKGKPREKDIY